jgi:hypothetical protein
VRPDGKRARSSASFASRDASHSKRRQNSASQRRSVRAPGGRPPRRHAASSRRARIDSPVANQVANARFDLKPLSAAQPSSSATWDASVEPTCTAQPAGEPALVVRGRSSPHRATVPRTPLVPSLARGAAIEACGSSPCCSRIATPRRRHRRGDGCGTGPAPEAPRCVSCG